MSIKKKLKDAIARRSELQKQADEIAAASETRGETSLSEKDVQALEKLSAEMKTNDRSIAVLQEQCDRLDKDAADAAARGEGAGEGAGEGGDQGGDDTETRGGGDNTDTRGLKPGAKPKAEYAADKDVFRSYGEQMRSIVRVAHARHSGVVGDEARSDMNKLQEVQRRGMVSSNEADGGYLLETKKDKSIKQMIFADSPLLSMVDQITLGPTEKEFTTIMVDDLSRVAGVRFGGVTAAWVGEGEGTTDSKVKFVEWTCRSGKIMSKARATDEMLRSVPQLEGVLFAAVRGEQRFMFAEGFYRGKGGKDPFGVLNPSNPAKLKVAIESGQTDKILFENIVKMNNRIIPSEAGNYIWIINPELMDYLPYLHITVGDNSYPVYVPPNIANGIAYGTLMGKPVVACEQCNAVGEEGDIALVNMTQYASIVKGSERTDMSMHVYFDTDELAFRIINYAGGKPKRHGVVTPARASANYRLADFITLAAR